MAHGMTKVTACASWIAAMANITKKPRDSHSEGTQAAVLELILSKVGSLHRRAVEFGFGYTPAKDQHRHLTGLRLLQHNTGLNTFDLRLKGWNVTYFDASIEDDEAGIRKAVLSEENIVEHFVAAGTPRDVDYVSIDVDSIDVWLLRALLLGDYRPRILSVEFNPNFGPEMMITCERVWHEWSRRTVFGASAAAINLVADMYGYEAVYVARSLPGSDIFFVRSDLLRAAGCARTSFAQLAAHLPFRAHRTCTRADAMRLRDLPLSLLGLEEAARRRAWEQIAHLESYGYRGSPLSPRQYVPGYHGSAISFQANPVCNLSGLLEESSAAAKPKA